MSQRKAVTRRRTPMQIMRGARRRARRLAGRLRRVWRRSLQLRVVTSTMVISVAVVAVLGIFLMQQFSGTVIDGRLNAAVRDALSDRTVILGQLNEPVGAAPDETGDGPADPAQTLIDPPIDRAAAELASRAGESSRYTVIIRRPAEPGEYRATNEIDPRSIPAALEHDMTEGPVNELHSRFTESLYYVGQHNPQPGIAIGMRLDNGYEVFHFFPLTEEEQLLSSVRGTLVVVGVALVLLLAAVAFLVTRQVVTPVRLARQAAELLAAGRLEERLKVRGEDDLARLAASFNEMAANLALKIHQLEELSQVQRQFVSDVSHELRTP